MASESYDGHATKRQRTDANGYSTQQGHRVRTVVDSVHYDRFEMLVCVLFEQYSTVMQYRINSTVEFQAAITVRAMSMISAVCVNTVTGIQDRLM